MQNVQVRTLKQQTNQLADQASQAKFDLSALQQETEQLQDQIVQVGVLTNGQECITPQSHRVMQLSIL